jgi:hypothetical protein
VGTIWLVIVVAYVAIVMAGRAQQEAKRRAQGEQGTAPDSAAKARAARREASRREMEQQLEEASRLRVARQPQPSREASQASARAAVDDVSRPRANLVSSIAPRLESRIVDRMVAPPSSAPVVAAPAASVPAAERLTRIAAGGLRGAFVLSEILGPPRGDA